jgi:hypothetical protein
MLVTMCVAHATADARTTLWVEGLQEQLYASGDICCASARAVTLGAVVTNFLGGRSAVKRAKSTLKRANCQQRVTLYLWQFKATTNTRRKMRKMIYLAHRSFNHPATIKSITWT